MKIRSYIISTLITCFATLTSTAQAIDNGREFVADLPDAIICIINNTQKTKYIYYIAGGAKGDSVRYDGPNGNLLHYDLPSGQLLTNYNPQPASADCVSQQLNLKDLIKKQRAYKTLTPMPSGGSLN